MLSTKINAAINIKAYGNTSHWNWIMAVFGVITENGAWILDAVACKFPVTSSVIFDTASGSNIDLKLTTCGGIQLFKIWIHLDFLD